MPTDAQIEFDNNVVLTHGFSKKMSDVLGRAQLFREGNKFYMSNIQLNTPRGEEVAKLLKKVDIFPAIGGLTNKREGKKSCRFFHKCGIIKCTS